MTKSYISPKVELRNGRIGRGLHAVKPLLPGELVIDFAKGPGKLLSTTEANRLFDSGNDYMIQVGDNEFFVATNHEELEEADFINHSCDPNCGIRGSLQIVALRKILPGDEITYDYAMSESSDYQLSCRCLSGICREVITGNDWKNKELQLKYKGFFSGYLEIKIDKLFSII